MQRGAGRRMGGLRHNAPKLVEVDRFGQVIKCTDLERAHGVVCRAVSRDDDAALVALLLLQPFDQLQPLPVGQTHIRYQHGKPLALQQCASLLQIGGAFYRVAATLQGNFVQGAQIGFIINNKHCGTGQMGRHD